MAFSTVACIQNGLRSEFFSRLKQLLFAFGLLAFFIIIISFGLSALAGSKSRPLSHPLVLQGGLYQLCLPPLSETSLQHMAGRCFWSGVFLSPDTDECFSIIFRDGDPQIIPLPCAECE